MKILYCAMKYDYGDPKRGLSFEHCNFYDTLSRMGHEIVYFDFMSLMKELGKEGMNARLLETVQREQPELFFCLLFTDEFDKETLREISFNTDTVTVNWFCDDHWRFHNFSRHWAPAFNWVTTTDSGAVAKYRAMGYQNVIKTQWACDHFSYKPLGLPLKYDVTFVGQPHGNRRAVIQRLRDAGIDVQAWGYGWENGRLSQEGMVEVFNQSRINLNLSNSSNGPWDKLLPWRRRSDQIKGRNFEVPGCGAFLLSGKADNLEEYYRVGNEIDCFTTTDELIEKIRFYLANESERAQVADAGYRRTLAEHTYEKRFNEIFARVGLSKHS